VEEYAALYFVVVKRRTSSQSDCVSSWFASLKDAIQYADELQRKEPNERFAVAELKRDWVFHYWTER